MNLQHLKDHKHKYIGFTIASVLAFFVTYVVYPIYAQAPPEYRGRRGSPMGAENETCFPLRGRRFYEFFFFMPRCVEVNPIVIEQTAPVASVPVITESTSTNGAISSADALSATSTASTTTTIHEVTQSTTTEEVTSSTSVE